MPTPPFRLFAIVPPGLEALARAELAPRVSGLMRVRGGLSVESDWRGLMDLHLHSRIASRILLRIGRFRARALGELERKAGEIPWEAFIPTERLQPGHPPIAIDVATSRSRLYHEGAVRERIQRAMGTSGEGEPESEPWRLQVRVHRDQVTLSLDATGDHLHRRGYRRHVGSAPMRETLAAATLLGSGWQPDTSLVDPFAGSGTIPIEAALLARRIPPALAGRDREPRDFPFRHWEGFPASEWTEAVGEARAGILHRAPAPIHASDRDGRVLDALMENARAAGVEEDLSVAEATVTRAPFPAEPGWIVTNPPYGGRLGDRRKLQPLYRALGRELAEGWNAWGWGAPVSDPALVAILQREVTRRKGRPLETGLQFRNGGILVTLLHRSRAAGDSPPPPDLPSDP